MESETILTPPSPSLAVFLFPSEPNIPEGQKYEKNINTLSMHGKKFYQIRKETMTEALERMAAKTAIIYI